LDHHLQGGDELPQLLGMVGVPIRIRLEVDRLARLEPVGQLVDEELQARVGLAVPA
jgi:hypothetical protein